MKPQYLHKLIETSCRLFVRVKVSIRKAGLVALMGVIMGIFVGCEDAHTPALKEPVKVSASTTAEKERIRISAPTSAEIAALSEQIKQSVKELEYSDKVAEDFVDMAYSWEDAQGYPFLVTWKMKLANTKENYGLGKVSKAQFAEVEESIVKELGQRIREEVSFNEKFFDLADIIMNKQAQCLGYSQLVYVLGSSINLSIRPMDVLELHSSEPLPSKLTHLACIVRLADGKSIMVDLVPGGFVSRPFIVEEEFSKVGNYWELKNERNPLGIHRRIRIRDKNGFIGSIYNSQGCAYIDLGQYSKAISEFTKAIELDPKHAVLYNNIGGVYSDLGQFDKAIRERTKAIELDPKFARAYYNRGNGYYKLDQVTQAISDYSKSIELNPKLTDAYNNRGVAYVKLGKLTQAISDYTKAIELDPKHTESYKNRGLAYLKLKQLTKAISDYNKAIELNPELPEAYNNRGTAYGELGQFGKAISDYNNAIKLDPAYAKAYYHRGLAQVFLENFEEAKKDLLKAIELDTSLTKHVKKISEQFKLNLQLD